MLADTEMKVSVAKKAPKKGMQLGKNKAKKNQLMQELEKQNVIENGPTEEQKTGEEEEEKK